MKHDEEDREIPALDFQHLKVSSAVGRGAKGVVFLVKDEASDEFVALKVIAKALIEGKGKADGGEYKRICFEQHVLRRLRHPLLPRLRGVLATENVVAYAIDYCPGGNLHSLRKRQTEKMFSDDVIR
jgi:serine/threonine protein kinase